MPIEVIMPKVDMDMATGRISRWFKAEGDAVAKGELLFEIETDKATMEIDSPAAGTLRDVSAGEGIDIPVGQPVAWIYAAGEVSAKGGQAPAAPAVIDVEEPFADTAVRPSDVKNALPAATDGVPPDDASSRSLAARDGAASGNTAPLEGLRATPLARRLARQRNIDLSAVSGSGPQGRIQARDVEAAVAQAPAAKQPEAPKPAPSPAQPAHAPEPAAPQAPVAAAPVRREDAGASSWLRREGDGVPLVLIHGFGSESASWRPFLAAFDRPMPILSIELPGHGAAADVPANGFDDLVAHVEAELAAQGVTVAHLAGHSLGGGVATAVASGSGVEARSLFLLAPAGFGPDINTGFTQGFAAARDEAAVRTWMNELVSDPAVFSDGFIKASLRARSDGRLAEAQTRLGPRLFADGTQRFSVRSLLGRSAVRTKVVTGTADRIVPARHMNGLPGRVALHSFAGLGHMPHLEDKQAVAQLLAELVR